jgi:tetratricopeptide (TPR) repeat protein
MPKAAPSANLRNRLLGHSAVPPCKVGSAIAAVKVRDTQGRSHRLKAESLYQSGQLTEALRFARYAVAQSGDDARCWSILGTILAAHKERAESLICFRKTVALDPGDVGARHNLANVLQDMGECSDAEICYRDVIKCQPDNALALTNFACLLNMVGRYDEAWALVERAIALKPDFAKAHLIGSAIQYNAGGHQAALAYLERAIALSPGQIRLFIRRAEILSKLGQNETALADCNVVIEKCPTDAEALRVKAFVLKALDRPEEAVDALREAQSSRCDPEIAVDRAWLLAELGRSGEARRLLDQTLNENPQAASALYCRAFLSRHTLDHPDVRIMENLVDHRQTSNKDRMRLSFSIGNIYLDAGDGKKAFAYLDKANALKRSITAYDCQIDATWFASIMELFSTENIANLSDGAVDSNRPLFVFGMPRSGTTLVEQILASHPQVCGKGEMPYLNSIARSSIFSPGLAGFGPDNLKACANRYLELSGAGVPPELRVVDKTLSNFLYAGLISLIFPNARMIHCRRDALDNCLSCYATLFGHGHEFSYDQADLAYFYRLYGKVMRHWNANLPKNAILDIDYRALIDGTETEIRRILDFCGLPWDDACLRFYETKRLVSTSSLNQVRSPIYRSSLGRAENFKPWLAPLMDGLAFELN